MRWMIAALFAATFGGMTHGIDDSSSGAIRGNVNWQGGVPEVPPLAGNVPLTPEGKFERVIKANPNRPVVDSASKGVGDVVVFLRGVDAKKTSPWTLPPVTVEQRDLELRIRQGGVVSRVGFVRQGAEVAITSKDKYFHSLRARGAAFFSLPFVDMEKPTVRKLTNKGPVELSSGAGYIWMRGHLFVDDHPHYARTSADGRYCLANVAEGKYELICWAPNWHMARRELDPESSQPTRVFYHPPLELVRPVTVRTGEKVEINFTISEEMFKRSTVIPASRFDE